ncbi:MAG: 30S ribosomal protein S4 [Myxococcota bacterium]|nr:30S ribosomal protein S4 [Myxococcota bacterium]
MKFTGPKVKLSRKIGVALKPKAQQALEKSDGRRAAGGGRDRLSDYGVQLLEKQRLRFQYNISEKQMRRYFEKASRMKGKTGRNLVSLLERRLDAVILRSGFAPTIFAARQIVSHGHFELNGHRVRIPSILIKPGDSISVRERSQKLEIFEMDWAAYTPPDYIERNTDELKTWMTRQPEREEIPVVCDEQYVVEYYSR